MVLFDRPALNRLYRYAYTLCGDEAPAYDLLQDTVERCLRQPPGEMTCPEAYARRVMRNRFIDICRRAHSAPDQPSIDGETEMLAIDTHCLESLVVAEDLVSRAWGLMDPFEREILYLWAVDGLTAAEIAVQLQTRRGTVLSRIHRLRQRLHALLDQGAVPGADGGSL